MPDGAAVNSNMGRVLFETVLRNSQKEQRSRVDVDLVEKRFSCNPPILGLAVFDLAITLL